MAGSKFQERMNKQGRDYIIAIRNTARVLWIKACEAEGVPSDSKFVVFSKENKFAEFYNIAMLRLQEAEAEYRAGGYVGLKIGH